MREAIRRKSHIGKVDFQKLKWLRATQRERNYELKGTGMYCNLRPDINKEACKNCPEKVRKECIHLEWERNYLLKETEKKISNKRRKCKQNNPKYWVTDIEIPNEYQEEDIKVTSEQSKKSCLGAEFGCPNYCNCEHGEKCFYGDLKKEKTDKIEKEDKQCPINMTDFDCPYYKYCNHGQKCPFETCK